MSSGYSLINHFYGLNLNDLVELFKLLYKSYHKNQKKIMKNILNDKIISINEILKNIAITIYYIIIITATSYLAIYLIQNLF